MRLSKDETRLDNTRTRPRHSQDKRIPKQDKTRREKTRKDKTMQENARKCKARKENARTDMTRQSKAGYNKAR